MDLKAVFLWFTLVFSVEWFLVISWIIWRFSKRVDLKRSRGKVWEWGGITMQWGVYSKFIPPDPTIRIVEVARNGDELTLRYLGNPNLFKENVFNLQWFHKLTSEEIDEILRRTKKWWCPW